MRLIDADKFLQDMADLYRQAGWGEREVHFSLADLRSNIDMEDVAVIPCKDCARHDSDGYCFEHGKKTDGADFCSWAERREE